MKKQHLISILLIAITSTVWATGTVEDVSVPDITGVDDTVALGIRRGDLPSVDESRATWWSTEVTGTPVRDFSNARVGTVTDLVFDASAGYTPYVVVAFDQTDRIDRGPYPLPLGTFRLAYSPRRLFFDVSDPARVEQAPTLADINPSQAVGDVVWDDRIHQYWSYAGVQAPPVAFQGGYRNYRFVGPGGGMRVLMGALATGSELMDHRIHDENGRPVASINDVVTSLVTGESPYLLLDTEWGLRPVPMEAFRLLGQSGRIQLAGTAAVLRQAPGIASRANVDLTEPGWDEEIRTYWTDSDVLVALRPGMRIVPGTVVRATRVAGLRVINTFGFAAGRITDFLFTADGDVPYALLDLFTDPTGENARFPVPLSAFTIDRNKTYAVTGLDRESMTRLPSLPDGGLEDLSWEGPVAAFWSDRYDLRFEARGERLVSFDAQIGKEVRLRNGDAVGEVAEVILDIEEGQVLYPVVQISAGLGLTRRVPIPLSHIRLESDRIVILAERDDLTEAPTFEDQPWPEIARVGWDQDVREHWSEIGR